MHPLDLIKMMMIMMMMMMMKMMIMMMMMMMICRLYRGVHHAPPGPHQDPVPAPDLHLGAVHRGQGLCPQDVRTGNTRCRYFRNSNKYFFCVHQEGLFSFWKGLLPPVLVETPKRAWKFFTFEQFQKVFLFGADKPGALVGSMSSLMS